MTQMVYDAFRKQKELNLMLGLQSKVEIGGRSGFIFNTKYGHQTNIFFQRFVVKMWSNQETSFSSKLEGGFSL